MHFIKIRDSYINLDNVTTIIKNGEGLSLGYVISFIGRNECCTVDEMDMADIRRELEKVNMLQNIDKIVLKTNEEMQKEVNALFEKQEKFKE